MSKEVSGVIRCGELYTLFRFKKLLGLTEAAFRALKRRGLPVFRTGKRAFLIGDEVIEFIRGLKSERESP